MSVDILDKNAILIAHITPTGANPDIVRPDPFLNPTLPIKIYETIINNIFIFKILYFFL